MTIDKVILVNYKRFSLASIKYLEYTPTKINTIAGSNGAGKTSLLERLSPFSAPHKSFNSDGYEETHITHLNSKYILLSKGTKHSFIKDNEELNQGGTQRVQNMLILEHFRLTPKIMDVFLGIKKFTEMSAMERKDWLTAISAISYDYPISVFNNAKSRLRDLQGFLKVLEVKLTGVEKNILSEKSYKDLTKYRQGLINFLEELQKQISDETSLDNPIKTISATLKKLKETETYDISTITPSIVLKDKISTVAEEIETLSNLTVEVEEIINVDELEKELVTLEAEFISLSNYNYIREDNTQACLFIQDNSVTISAMETVLRDNDLGYTQEKITDILSRHHNKSSYLLDIINEIGKLESKLSVLQEAKDSDSVNCPECNADFKVNYDETNYNNTIVFLKKFKEIQLKLSKEVEALDKDKVKIEKYQEVKNEMLNFFRLYPSVLERILENGFNQVLVDTADLIELPTLEKEVTTIKENLSKTKATNDEKNKEIINRNIEIENKLHKLYKNRIELKRQLKRSVIVEQGIGKVNALAELLDSKVSEYDSFVAREIQLEREKHIKEIIDFTKKEISEVTILISSDDNSRYLLSTVREDIEKTRSKIITVKSIVDGLSPNSGLIAKSLNSFIGQFINTMNNVISKVWEYDMKVVSPTIEDGDISYKFPVYTTGEPSEDVKATSTGMSEIINVAFILASMRFLKMTDYPVFLDEFAGSFDKVHKRKATEFINSIASETNQLFLISHNEDVIYSGAYETSNTVLSTDNIENFKARNTNKNLKFK